MFLCLAAFGLTKQHLGQAPQTLLFLGVTLACNNLTIHLSKSPASRIASVRCRGVVPPDSPPARCGPAYLDTQGTSAQSEPGTINTTVLVSSTPFPTRMGRLAHRGLLTKLSAKLLHQVPSAVGLSQYHKCRPHRLPVNRGGSAGRPGGKPPRHPPPTTTTKPARTTPAHCLDRPNDRDSLSLTAPRRRTTMID